MMLLSLVIVGIGLLSTLWLGRKITELDPKRLGSVSKKWVEEHRYQYPEKDKH